MKPSLHRSSLAALLFAGAALCPPAAFADEPAARGEPTTRDFFRHPEFQGARISPTGRYLATSLPIEGTTSLAVIDLQTQQVSAAFQVDPDLHVGWFDWINDERVAFTTHYKSGSLDQPVPTGMLFAGNADGSKRVRILGGDSYVGRSFVLVDKLEADPRHILVEIFNDTRYHELFELDVYTGRKRMLERSPVRNGVLVTDHEGTPRLAIGGSEKAELIVKYRAKKGEDWKQIGSYAAGEQSLRPLAFLPDNRHILVASTLTQPNAALAQLDPETGEVVPLVTDARYDVMDDFGEQLGLATLLTARDNRTPIGVAYDADLPRVTFFAQDHPDVAIYQRVLAAFVGQRVSFGNFTADGNQLVLRVTSDVNPGDFYLFDVAAGKARYLMSSRSWIDPAQMLPMRAVTIPARDGLQLPAYLTLPKNADKPVPLIVLPHGGPHGPRDFWGWHPEAQFFAHHGYAVLQVNFRGSGGLGRDYEAAGYKRWGREMQDDLTDATHWAVEQGVADPQRLCIYGGSYGGYAALMGAIREPDLYKCAVGYVGVYDLSLMFEKADYLRYDRNASLKVMQLYNGTDPVDWQARSPAFHVDRIKAALLIVTGKKDPRVPFEHHKRLTAALDKAGKPYETLVKAKEGHGFYNEDNRVELYDRLLEFFDTHIGTQSAIQSGTRSVDGAAEEATSAP